jgi:hypothetical protein
MEHYENPLRKAQREERRKREVTPTTGRQTGGHELRHPDWRANYNEQVQEQLSLLENTKFYSLNPHQPKKPKK